MKKSVLVTAPPTTAIALSELKSWVRVDGTDDDTLLTSILSAAQQQFEDLTGRKLGVQTWKLYIDKFPRLFKYIVLPYGNLSSVTHLKYTDSNGTQNTLSSSCYSVDTVSDLGRIVLNYGEVWPGDSLATNNPIEIQFVCGAAATEEQEAIIKMIGASFYENRDPDAQIQGLTDNPMRKALNNLIARHRLYFEWS